LTKIFWIGIIVLCLLESTVLSLLRKCHFPSVLVELNHWYEILKPMKKDFNICELSHIVQQI